jgi:hypothetical protein
MSQSLRQYPNSNREACNFEVLSDNAEGIRCEEGIVTIPKSNFGHLSVDEHEFILMKFLEIERNHAEVPKTVLLNAKRTKNDIRISGQYESFIFDDEDAAYLDLLRRPVPA